MMDKFSTWTLVALSILLCSCTPKPPAPPGPPADGKTDATAQIQQELDQRGQTGGEVVLPPGQYLIAGSLHIPTGVTLRGSWDAPHHGGAWKVGTTLLITGGRGQEHGPAAITLDSNSALEGVTMLWPDQIWSNIQPYPWAIEGRGSHATIENVTLVNAYQGIWVGSHDGSLHLIRNVFGCVLRKGIFVDRTTDIGRIENIHFNTHYWLGSGHPSSTAGVDMHVPAQRDQIGKTVVSYVGNNLDAFVFGRSDWEYMINTFVWDAHYAYAFIQTGHGACNGQFVGIGADYCKTCVEIENIQDVGLQVTNGEFTAFAGDPNTAIVTEPGAMGAAQFVNCNFWGVKNHVLWMKGDTQVTLADCHIVDPLPAGAVLAERGKLIVQGCNFSQPCPAVILEKDVQGAIILGNLESGGVQIQNGIGNLAQIGLNEPPPKVPQAPPPVHKI